MERGEATAAVWDDGALACLPDPVCVVDGEWRMQYINPLGQELLDRPAEELIGRSIWESFPHLPGTPIERELRRARAEGAIVTVLDYFEPLDAWFSVRAGPFGPGLLITVHDFSEFRRTAEHAAELAEEKAALARIADSVARQVPPRELFSQVAEEAAGLHDVEAGAVFRFTGPHEVEVVGLSSTHATQLVALGAVADDDGMFDELRQTGEPVVGRITDDSVDPVYRAEMRDVGRGAWLHLPIVAGGRLWGALAFTSQRTTAFDEQAVERQRQFAELLSIAISNADAHDQLERMAATDPVTGLANHRVFHARLREEVAEAMRLDRSLSLALFDVDRFGDVNDLHGHLAGDAIIAEVADRLIAVAQPGQMLARIGGDEFALIMPGHQANEARAVIERARGVVASRPFGEHGSELTISAGIADLASAGHGDLLFASADGALYWAKLNGRDLVWTFEPSIVSELSPTDRAETLLRRQRLAGVTALARAIDAKDPSTRQHSERVAELAEQLALALGWDKRRARLLRKAALVHDVGKIGVPDALLLSSGRLTEEEYEVIKRHAALGAEIVGDVLDEEQVGWVRSHHERPDGRGYPDGLRAGEIPTGAALLSIADAVDVMTVGRPYSPPMPLEHAVEECERLVGQQFTEEAAHALRTLYRAGVLEAWDSSRN